MGMYGVVWRVTEADVRRLATASAREVNDFLFGAPSGPVRAKGLRGWFNRISPITIESYEDYLDAPRGPGGAKAELEVDKAWHGLHFLFTGTAWEGDEPACFLVQGGSVLGEDADEEALPRVLSAPQVAAFAGFLGDLSREALARRYDPARMMEMKIYPEIWDRDAEAEQNRNYLLDAFDALRDFVVAAAAEGDRLVVMVT
jgi:hypothetical protein